MAMFYAIIVAFCIADTAFAQIFYPGKCLTIKSQSNLDFKKIQGKWYEVARYPTSYLQSTSCVIAHFSSEENGVINEVDNYINDTTGEPRAIYTQMVISHEDPSVQEVKFPLPGINAPSNCQILGTDYDNYEVYYCCTQLYYINLRYVFILTKVPVPDKSILHKAYEMIAENGLSTKPIRMNNWKNCSTSSAE